MQILTDKAQKEIKEHGSYAFPLLFSKEKLSSYDSGAFLWHWHPEIEIIMVQEGRMIYQVNQEIFRLGRGDILFQNAGVLHSGHMDQKRDCCYLSITFDPKLIYGFENSLVWQKYVEPVVRDFSMPAILMDQTYDWHEEGAWLIRELVRIHDQEEKAFELDLPGCLQKFWRLLVLNCPPQREAAAGERLNYDRIRTILTYIEMRYGEPVRLDEIAEQVHLCKGECCRLFKRYMKMTLFDFILDYRIEKSLAILSQPGSSVMDAAAQVGFSDSNYFSRVFSKRKGCSPAAYKKKRLEITRDMSGIVS